MSYSFMLIACSFIFSSYLANAVILTTPTTFAGPNTAYNQHSVTTPPPRFPSAFELQKRKVSPGTICGWLSRPKEGSSSWEPWIVSDGYYCAGTVLPDGSAYAYSSDPEVGAQYRVWTTAIGNWDSKKPCPTSATCCSGDNPIVQTYYFTGGPYTITSWWCSTKQLTQTWIPAKNLLETKDFSVSLARATASSAAGASSGLSSDTKIGIGVGVAVGIGVILLAGAVFLFWRRRHMRLKENADGASQTLYHQGTSYDPRIPYHPQAWQNNASCNYYKQDQHAQTWSHPPSQELRLQELSGSAHTGEAQELPGGAKNTGVLGQHREQQRYELSADYI